MTAQAVTSLPSGRTIYGWWRELSARRPNRLWFANLLLYRVEALVEIGPPPGVAELCQALLLLLAREPGPIATHVLATQLQADVGLLGALLAELQRSGLVSAAQRDGAAAWQVAHAGKEQSPAVHAPGNRQTRRSFSFALAEPSLYLPVSPAAATPITPPAGLKFDLTTLEACVAQDPEWKARHGFPVEVVQVVRPSPNVDDWRAVPLVRFEQAPLVLIESAEGGEVVGFPVRSDNWSLAREVALAVPGGVAALTPLLAEADPNEWKKAFQIWCNQRSLPTGEVDACQLSLAGHRLVVKAPARMVDRLRTARSDALKGEAWLLAGGVQVKAAAQIDLGEGM